MTSPRRLKIAPALRPGDRVRVVAPSGAFDRAPFEAGIACMERAELVPVYDDGVFSRHRYLAGDDARRLAELTAALSDPDAAAVWVARGGYGITRLLPALVATPEVGSSITTRPKWLVGFSDVTALHALWQRHGLVSMHGPNVTTLDGWSAEARRGLWDWLRRGEGPALPGVRARGTGAVRGWLCGGNLTVLAALAGGGALPAMEGAIVLLEDIGERPYRLDRALTTLFQAGVFAGVVGFAIGQLTSCADPPERGADWSALDVVTDVIAAHAPDAAVLTGVPVGHEPSSFPLPLGWPAVLDCEAETLTVDPLR